jgi:hypothetical protein
MRLPRIRIRTVLIAVAVVGVLLAVVLPWWRYWFQSPWRLVTVMDYTSPDGQLHADHLSLFFDMRKPGDASRFRKTIRAAQSQRTHFTVERFTSFPGDRFPTFTDADVRRLDPPPEAPSIGRADTPR